MDVEVALGWIIAIVCWIYGADGLYQNAWSSVLLTCAMSQSFEQDHTSRISTTCERSGKASLFVLESEVTALSPSAAIILDIVQA